MLFWLPSVTAYGTVGHWISGKIASELLSDAAKKYIAELVPDLAQACLWADQIKGNPSYRWSFHLHYVNPIDDKPPETCSYQPGPRDCPNGNLTDFRRMSCKFDS